MASVSNATSRWVDDVNMYHIGGHLFPGLLFFILGSWWCFAVWRRYFLNRKSFSSSASFPVPKYFRKICLEGYLKIFFVLIGIAAEVYTGMKGGHMHIPNIQHTVMYTGFGLVGVADILTYKKYRLPPKTNYMVLLLATTVEGSQFSLHLHGRTPVDVMVHKLLVYSAIAEAVFIALEMRDTRCVVYALGRAFWASLHGAWMVQITFMLYIIPTRLSSRGLGDSDQMMVVGATFGWFMIGFLVYVALVGWLVNLCTSSHDFENGVEEERIKLMLNSEVYDAAEEDRINSTGAV